MKFSIGSDDYKVNYIHKKDHRDNSMQKSQWVISKKEEIKCFQKSFEVKSTDAKNKWGLHIVNDKYDVLGVTKPQKSEDQRKLIIAKFVGGEHSLWHGYPADTIKKQQDRPNKEYLRKWKAEGLLSKAKIQKINQGKL